MTSLCCDLLKALNGRTFSTAESCTGGGIGAAVTAVPGSSAVYKGGVICYTNWVKENVLGVSGETLQKYGAVSAQTAQEMALCIRRKLRSTYALSVTGIAGPDSDERNTPVGTVYIGFSDGQQTYAKQYHFEGDRDTIRKCAIDAALSILLAECK